MQIEKLLAIPLKDNGIIKILIGGVLQIIPVIGWLLNAGFAMKCYEKGIEEKSDMPEWDDWGQKFINGVMVVCAVIIYMIVPLLAYSLGILLFGEPGFFLFLVLFLLAVAFGFILPMGICNLAVYKRFTSAFDFSFLLRLLKADPGTYVRAFLIYLLAVIVIGIVSMIPLIGWIIGLFSCFYLQCVSGYLFGGVYRKAFIAVNGMEPDVSVHIKY